MDENAIRQWLIDCFGPIQGEMAWNQLSNLPDDDSRAAAQPGSEQAAQARPKCKSLMQAFTAGGLNTDGRHASRPWNRARSTSSWRNRWRCSRRTAAGSRRQRQRRRSAKSHARRISEANLWLDTACEFNPAPGETQAAHPRRLGRRTPLTRGRSSPRPSAESMNDALASVICRASRRGAVQRRDRRHVRRPGADSDSGRHEGSGAADANCSATRHSPCSSGRAAGDLSHEVRGSFDQGIALLKNPAGATDRAECRRNTRSRSTST